MSRPLRIRPLFPAEQVEARIAELAEEIAGDPGPGPAPVWISIAEGARRFTEALLEAWPERRPRPEVREIRARRTRGTELVALEIEGLDPGGLGGRDVLVVDDIADEGRTLRAVLEVLEDAECRSLGTAVLVDKRASRREPLHLDHVGFVVESGWVVGFGMDVDGELRDLDEIGVLEEAG